MHVASLNIGRPQLYLHRGRSYSSAINRAPCSTRVRLIPTGFENDRVSDTKHHGGPDKAVCCYPIEHYEYIAARLGREIAVPAFGENLTTAGLLETAVCLGDTYRIADAVLQVSQPRQPCSTLARKHDHMNIITWINETAFTGFYLRVLEPGLGIATHDPIELLDRPVPDLSIERLIRTMLDPNVDRELLQRLAAHDLLSEAWRKQARNKLNPPSDPAQEDD